MNKKHLKMVNVNYWKDQISLYCHFNKIIKGSDSSFQSVALSQEFVLKIQKK